MLLSLTIVSPDPDSAEEAASRAAAAVAVAGEAVKLGPGAVDLPVIADDPRAVRHAVESASSHLPIDVCVQPAEGRRKKLFVADMDSTIIGCECLDELADFAGVKAEVAEITERAMRGDLQFEGALRERVAMLKGLGLDALQKAYDERVRLNPGARTLVQTMRASGTRCILVSGGFTFFTTRVTEAAGFHAQRANTLTEDGAVLAGTVGDPILGKEAKLAALREEAAALGLDLSQTIAIGDGANDLAMIEASGLGIAYRAKPVVAAQADVRLDHADLTAVLYFQGYRAEEFAS